MGLDKPGAVAARFDALRRRLGEARGPEYWRSLDELAQTPEFAEFLAHEFPSQAEVWPQTVDRRRFLQLMGASFALAGLGACTRQPLEDIVPHVRRPEDLVPGRPQYFATALTLDGYATGVLVESHDGRPTKIEGNPDHPASLGSTDRFTQAALLDLYDPDRARSVSYVERTRTWEAFSSALANELAALESTQGEGLRILSGAVTSPTWEAQMQRVLERFPRAHWHRWDGANVDGLRDATRAALGRPVSLVYDFSATDVVVSLESDFLTSGAGSVRYAHDFMQRRRISEGQYGMNRLYAFESTPTSTGAVADHRLALEPDLLLGFVYGLARELGVHGTGYLEPFQSGELQLWLEHVGNDLRRTAGRCVVVAGEHTPPEVQALALAINAKIGNFGKTIFSVESIEVDAVNQMPSLRQLTDDVRGGHVQTLLILGGNPVYDAPADLRFAEALDQVAWSAHLTGSRNETSERCHWMVPQAHELETWSDARAYDGTATVMQPLIEPLFGGKSVHEILALVSGESERTPRDIVRRTWRERFTGSDFEAHWRRIVHDGVVPETTAAPVVTEFQRGTIISLGSRTVQKLRPRFAARRQGISLAFRPDPNVHDGRFANNGWLQELPKPWTRLTWDNAALISPRLAEEYGLQDGDVVELDARGALAETPVWILPGQAERTITLHLGYGRTRVGRVGAGTGVDACMLRSTGSMSHAERVEIRKTGRRQRLATTQDHFSMEGRHLVRETTLNNYRRDPEFAHHVGHHGEPVSMYPDVEYDGYAWGMVVNLGACTGCNACVVACNAENNIPVVGKEQVLLGREMHWIRIDRYYNGSLDRPKVAQQPVLCMHCENAPCEVVCPVGATVHSQEGLNEMVYNRCVGTRYCSNNCPYKVRRFNFLQYSDEDTEVLRLMRNPDVSVRTRGVMEKCTYCVQRINQSRIAAKKEGRTLQDGDVLTACQQVCPTDALVFGDVNDPNSEISKLRSDSRHYSILEELNTRARTTYLARVSNPLPPLDRLERNLAKQEQEEPREH